MVKVRDLPDLFGWDGPRPLLYCQRGGCEYSAHRGDYVTASPETVLRCHGRPLLLATRQTTYTPWRPARKAKGE